MINKNIIQFVLVIFLTVLSIFFYQKYLVSNNENKKLLEKEMDTQTTNKQLILEEKKNIENEIESLRYTSEDLLGNTYIIDAETAQVEEGKVNQVKLFVVTAKIIQKEDGIIYINSNFADYDRLNNNTIFKDDVNVRYGDQSIDADIINFNFLDNLIKIEENVLYKNNNAEVNADKIEIDMESKKLKISMNKQEDKVEIFTKY
ncbi:hypothetical protein OBA37_00445 [Candidatus Pelagibacter sp.]|nr:hypothetical protein [Candidatus Pelagibacter sp.]